MFSISILLTQVKLIEIEQELPIERIPTKDSRKLMDR